MNAHDFIDKWAEHGSQASENERQGAQPFFLDLCEFLGVPKPGELAGYSFEKQTLGQGALGQQRGFADVFYEGRFAWENKAPGKNLDAALNQLRGYALHLSNPPLLIVSDRLTTRIHTQFTGHPSETHVVKTSNLRSPEVQQLLRRVWLDPESFRPKITTRDITEQAAKSFAKLADGLRNRGPQSQPEKAQYAERVAHFLTQTLFCFFAQDVGLLPGGMFEKMLGNRHLPSAELTKMLQKLMETMQTGGAFGSEFLPWFNGGLFKNVNVPRLEVIEVTELRNAARMNWRSIDVSIFGTLFERGLDPAKRSQLGAHYTDPATIERIIEPVIRRPLLQKWELLSHDLRAILARNTPQSVKKAQQQFSAFLESLAEFKVLDPACGSGNFLYLGLKALKDLELHFIAQAEKMGLQRPVDLCTGPANMHGIEINEYAAELARVTVWIGELQWRMDHGYPFKENPILEPLDLIEQRDSLITFQPVRPEPVEGEQLEAAIADWPRVSVVVGNPPFLGDKKMRGELGDEYVNALRKAYEGKVPGGADLVCYWFEQARRAIETQGLGAAGLVATQSIRAGANRKVLQRICDTSRIYNAWSDEPWVNEGAAVRVSLVALGWGECCFLNGEPVEGITADLSDAATGDITKAQLLKENIEVAFQGPVKVGSFDVSGAQARFWLSQPNISGQPTSTILRPWANGRDLTQRYSDTWIIDFGVNLPESQAMLFEQPYQHVLLQVKPQRLAQNDAQRKLHWWLHGRSGEDIRNAMRGLQRYIATPRVAKHRFFVWLPQIVWPDSRLYAICRSDDLIFGILSSRIHEIWSLATASIHGDGAEGGRPTYNAKSCFETFPFPEGLSPADTAHQTTQALHSGAQIPAKLSGNIKAQASVIAEAAHQLNALRERWLNPPEWTRRESEVIPLGMSQSPYPDRILPRDGLSQADAKALQQRTLTNLYNQKLEGKVQWLTAAHEALDQAVACAYGWQDYSAATPDEEILRRLLALNAAQSKPV